MKIFVGTHENCGIIASLSGAFKKLGHDVVTWVKVRDRFFQEASYDFDFTSLTRPEAMIGKQFRNVPILNRGLRKLTDWRNARVHERSFNELPDFDLYIYTWDTALQGQRDLELLKSRGKKIIVLFIGSDARYAPAFNQQFPNTPIPWSAYQLNESINKKIRFLRKVETFADQVFSLPDQAGLQIRPYWHMYMPFELERYTFNYPDNTVPKIVHAPSNPALKGTDRILMALDDLRSEGCAFEFIRIENMPNTVVQQNLVGADIAIDQIYAHGPGIFGIEAMASGCALAVRYLKGHEAVFNPPVCYIDAQVLKDNLRKLLTDRAYRRSLAYEGRKFVEQYNGALSVAQRILGILDAGDAEPDYRPDYFINGFRLENGQKISVKNKQVNRALIQQFADSSVNWQQLKDRELI